MKLNKVVNSVSEGEQELLLSVYRKLRDDYVNWSVSNFNITKDKAQIIFQEVLFSFYSNVNSGRITRLSADLRSYLFQISKHKITGLLQLKPEFCQASVSGWQLSDAEHVTGGRLSAEGAEDLQFKFDLFDDGQKRLLRLFYIQNHSLKEVAKILALKNAEAARLKRNEAVAQLHSRVIKPGKSISSRYFDEINNYLFGNMVAGEKALFQARMLIDSDLSRDVLEFEDTIAIFHKLDRATLLRGFRAIDWELDVAMPPGKRKIKVAALSLAAVFVVLIGAAAFLFRSGSHQKIARFDEQEIGLPVVMGDSDRLFDNAMSYYKMNEYEKSLGLLNNIALRKGADTLNYFRGINHYMLSDYRSAIASFRSVGRNSSLYFKASYKLGLAFWYDDQPEQARKIFTQLKALRSPYQQRAAEILKELPK